MKGEHGTCVCLNPSCTFYYMPFRTSSIKHTQRRPQISVKQMLMGIQDLLDSPNVDDPAQHEAYRLYTTNLAEYKKRVKVEARKNATPA